MAYVRSSSVGGYVEFDGGDRRSVSSVASYLEIAPGVYILTTAVSAYIEQIADDKAVVQNVAALVESDPGPTIFVSTVTAYIEIVPDVTGSLTAVPLPAPDTSGQKVSDIVGIVGLQTRDTLVSQLFAYAELVNRHLYATKFLNLVEISLDDLRITKVVNLVEIEYETPEPPNIMPVHFPSSAGTRHMHDKLPDEISGYAFDPDHSWWSTVIPEESTNLITNPSFEVWNDLGNILSYDWGGTFTANAFVEFPLPGATAGRRCATFTTTGSSGWLEYDEGISVTPGPYTFSVDVYTTRPPTLFYLAILDMLDNTIGSTFYTVKRTGWSRISLTAIEIGSGQRKVRLTALNTNPSGVKCYTDAWQFEAKAYATTYLDGDMVSSGDVQPYQSYFWHGTPHQSPSTRREYANTGGRPVSWHYLVGFQTTALLGLAMSPIELRSQQMSDGQEIHKGVNKLPRDFSITGKIYGEDYTDLMRRHNTLVGLLKPNKALGSPQTILRYQRIDVKGQAVGAPMDILCMYRDGLQGTINGLYQETLPLQFHASQPFWQDVIENSAEIQLRKQITANGIIYKDEDGDYQNLGTGDTGAFARRVGFLFDGSPVVAGPFNQFAGDTVSKIAKWNGTHWENLGTWTGGTILDMDTGYKTGYPPVVSDTSAVWELDPIIGWQKLGGDFDHNVLVVRRDINGNVWAGGNFEKDAAATKTFNGIAKWNYQTEEWEVMQEGLIRLTEPDDTPGIVTSILATNDGMVYIGGDFYRAEEPDISTTQLATKVIIWNDNTGYWEGMGIGVDLEPLRMLQGKDGYIYAVGHFTTSTAGIYSVPIRGFMRYTGYQWEEVFPLVSVDGTVGCDGFAMDENGVFWFFKYVPDEDAKFNVSAALGPVEFFGWKDGVFYPPFASVTNGMWDMAIGPGNRMISSIIRFAESLGPPIVTANDLNVPYLNNINYAGNADAPLVFHLEGPLNPVFVDNLTLKGGAYFKYNMNLGDNEQMIIRNDTQRAIIYSNGRSSLQRFIIPGLSSMSALSLLPGRNRISVFCLNPVEDDSIGWITWKNRFWGSDGA